MRDRPILAEALRLFFPLAAAHGALLPFLWIVAGGYDLPFSRDIPTSQWHAHEMIFGTYGMALAGFLASAVPEWTDTRPAQGRSLLWLAALWLPGRLAGAAGADALNLAAGAFDLAFFLAVAVVIGRAMLERRTTQHLAFLVWLLAFASAETGVRLAWHMGDFALSARLLEAALCIFVVLFSLSAARINVVVINLALDPSGETTPYRPHPGRRHTAGAMVTLYMVAILVFPESGVAAWLALAAGAAFFDRLAEWFVGRAVFRTEVAMLALGNAFAGAGFLALGATRLGAALSPAAGLHMLSIGALGSAVMGVFIIAGLRHTGRNLRRLPWQAHGAAALMVAAALVRIVPEFDFAAGLSPWHHAAAALLWAASFGVWLHGFLPFLAAPGVDEGGACA
ncbi:NnrS family protein [Shinella pollutisoli]|uniref:NnrS family protein n=1 Tax=Shinella pollutisoli TaxID=2250594 RepID=A0ABV7DFI3_9HYPH|nr:NnrS family protein [Shinella pollutisoli]